MFAKLAKTSLFKKLTRQKESSSREDEVSVKATSFAQIKVFGQMAVTEEELMHLLDSQKSDKASSFGRYITSNVAFEANVGLLAFGHADGSIKIFQVINCARRPKKDQKDLYHQEILS